MLAPLPVRDQGKVVACGTDCYIAVVNIEEANLGTRSEAAEHEPFGGIVLTDTFNLSALRDQFLKLFLPDNGGRVERQDDLPVQVSSRPFNVWGNEGNQGERSRQEGRKALGKVRGHLTRPTTGSASRRNPRVDDDADH